MKTCTEKKQQVYVALTERGRHALRSLRQQLHVSQSDAVEFAILLAQSGRLAPSEERLMLNARTQEAIEGL